MYSIDLVGPDLVIKNTKNPRVNNQFVVATIPQSSNDLTWAFTEDERRVKLIANGVALTPTLFSEVKVSGVACTSKADFISKMSVLSDFAGPVSAPSPYKVYTAQILMGDGSATVFENTLGVTITWTATSGQISSGTVTGLIGQNNVYVQVSSSTPSGNNIYIVSGEFSPSPWVVRVEQNDNTGSPTNEQSVFVEIRLYN
jgi:hypothetical protein